MDRGIPVSGNEDIELYMRTYYSLLRSSGEVEIRSLEETHSGMGASLHQEANSPNLDMSAFVYSAMRLPACITQIRLILLGQSGEVFARRGYPKIESWSVVKARARRRKIFFDGQETLAVFINSISDIDDLIPMLTTYQIEWNKMHDKLLHIGAASKPDFTERDYQAALSLGNEDFDRLQQLWKDDLLANLRAVAQSRKRFAFNLLAGSRTDYRRATQSWWQNIMNQCNTSDVGGGYIVSDESGISKLALRLHHLPLNHYPDVHDRPAYFVSSNMHTLPNLLSHYSASIKDELLTFLEENNPEGLYEEYQQLSQSDPPGNTENLFYYVMRKYLRTPAGNRHYNLRLKREIGLGIHNVRRPLNLDVGVQVIELSKLDPAYLDSRIQLANPNWDKLRQSQALVINVDYPLGMAAYQVLSQLSANVGALKGIYILGKAATLNGRVGDVMIPNVVYDEHSQNTYLFRNCFTAQDVAPLLKYGTVMDNQKAITVRGTFLQNREFMHLFYKEGYTDIEMETGPYLSAMYENLYPKRYPVNEIVNLFQNLPYDLGVLHYASDTPYSKRQSLLSKSMLYFGMDSTYATGVAIVKRILENEMEE